jgi:hypothetical protein
VTDVFLPVWDFFCIIIIIRTAEALNSERDVRKRLDKVMARLSLIKDKYNALREEDDTRASVDESLAMGGSSVGSPPKASLPEEEGFMFAKEFEKYQKKIAQLEDKLEKGGWDSMKQTRLEDDLKQAKLEAKEKVERMRTEMDVELTEEKKQAQNQVAEAAFQQKRKDTATLLSQVWIVCLYVSCGCIEGYAHIIDLIHS